MPAAADNAPILITGAAGFIGAQMARRLAEKGRRVAALDLPGLRAPHLEHANVTRFEADVTSRQDCDRILHSTAPRAIVHCAAIMGSTASREEFFRVNEGGTRALAGAAASAGVRRFLYISSVTVHGMPPKTVVDEEAPRRSIGLAYADSKIAAEDLLKAMHERREISVTILRPGDVYGPRAGEWVVKLVESLRAGKMIYIGGGRGFVNACYVDNLIDAVEICLDRDASAGRAYLITDGPPVTWKRYLTALAGASGTPPPRLSIPAVAAWPMVMAMEAILPRLGKRPPLGKLGLRILTASCSYSIERARRELGWSPAIGFDDGMQRVAAWLRQTGSPVR